LSIFYTNPRRIDTPAMVLYLNPRFVFKVTRNNICYGYYLCKKDVSWHASLNVPKVEILTGRTKVTRTNLVFL